MASPPFKKVKIDSVRPTSSSGSSATMTEDSEVTQTDWEAFRLIQSTSDEFHFMNSHIRSYDLSLYYDGSAPATQFSQCRALRILLIKPDSNNDQIPPASLTSGWIHSNQSVNLFLEGGLHLPGLERQCHLQFEAPAKTIKAGDVRYSLAKILDTELFNIQLEFLPMETKADTTIFDRKLGTCRGASGAWNDTRFDDRSTVEEILSQAQSGNPHTPEPKPDDEYMWFRVSHVETISLNMSDDHFTSAFTPDHTATVGNLRELVAALRSKETGAIHLHLDDRELREEDYPLQAEGLTPGSQVSCWLEVVDCAVCGGDEIPYTEFEQPITAYCLHKRQTCSECIRTWIATKLENGLWDSISCPGHECKEVLEYADMKRFASDDHFERYVM
jgi:hypothetical protein